MIGIEQEALATHYKLNELYLNLEIRLTLEDSFNFIEETEYLIRKTFNKDLSSLYKKVLNRLANKNGVVELTPKKDGKLHELYKAIDFIYRNEYVKFNFKWNVNDNSTQGDIPFLLSTKQNKILEKLKIDKDLIMNTMNNALNIEDFISKIAISNTNIRLNKIYS